MDLTLSDPECVAYSRDHLLHEVRMLLDTGSLLRDQRYLKSMDDLRLREALHFAVLESFVTHARALIAFFYPDEKNKWKGEVLARDFFDRRQLPSTFPSISPLLTDVRRRVSKEVAHLTIKRIAGQPPKKDWRVPDVLEELRKVLLRFLNDVSPSRISPDVGRFVEEWGQVKKTTFVMFSASTCSPI